MSISTKMRKSRSWRKLLWDASSPYQNAFRTAVSPANAADFSPPENRLENTQFPEYCASAAPDIVESRLEKILLKVAKNQAATAHQRQIEEAAGERSWHTPEGIAAQLATQVQSKFSPSSATNSAWSCSSARPPPPQAISLPCSICGGFPKPPRASAYRRLRVLLPLHPSGSAPAEPSTPNLNVPQGQPKQTAEVDSAVSVSPNVPKSPSKLTKSAGIHRKGKGNICTTHRESS